MSSFCLVSEALIRTDFSRTNVFCYFHLPFFPAFWLLFSPLPLVLVTFSSSLVLSFCIFPPALSLFFISTPCLLPSIFLLLFPVLSLSLLILFFIFMYCSYFSICLCFRFSHLRFLLFVLFLSFMLSLLPLSISLPVFRFVSDFHIFRRAQLHNSETVH